MHDVRELEILLGGRATAVEAGTLFTGAEGLQAGERAFILAGELVASVGHHDVHTFLANDIVGGPVASSNLRIRAVTPVRLLLLQPDVLTDLHHDSHPFAREVDLRTLESLTRLLRSLDLFLDDLPSPPLDVRLGASPFERLRTWLGAARQAFETPDAAAFLRDDPLCAGLPEHGLATIAGAFVAQRVPAGHVFFREGQEGQDLFLLMEGSVEALSGDDDLRKLGTVEPGEVFGATSIFELRPRMATCVATRESVVLRLGADAFEALSRDRHASGRALRGLLVQSLAATVARAAASVEGRLGALRTDLASSLGELHEASPLDEARHRKPGIP